MDEQKYLKQIQAYKEKLPAFTDGRIDYRKSDSAPVLNVFVQYKSKILLLKRSDKVGAYKGLWNSIGGFLDEVKPLREKAIEELQEELGITEKDVEEVLIAEPYEFFDSSIPMKWLIHPVLVILQKEPDIRLDWEHTDFVWIDPSELMTYDRVPRLEKVWERLVKSKN